jgi:hypothetical protein
MQITVVSDNRFRNESVQKYLSSSILKLYSWKEGLILKHTGPWPKHLVMPRNASLVTVRGHVVAFL